MSDFYHFLWLYVKYLLLNEGLSPFQLLMLFNFTDVKGIPSNLFISRARLFQMGIRKEDLTKSASLLLNTKKYYSNVPISANPFISGLIYLFCFDLKSLWLYRIIYCYIQVLNESQFMHFNMISLIPKPGLTCCFWLKIYYV